MASRQKPAAPSGPAAPTGSGSKATRHAEIETKLEIAPDATLPDLSKRRKLAATGVVAAAEPATYHLDATYYDTSNLDLLRSRMTLRRRTGGAGSFASAAGRGCWCRSRSRPGDRWPAPRRPPLRSPRACGVWTGREASRRGRSRAWSRSRHAWSPSTRTRSALPDRKVLRVSDGWPCFVGTRSCRDPPPDPPEVIRFSSDRYSGNGRLAGRRPRIRRSAITPTVVSDARAA